MLLRFSPVQIILLSVIAAAAVVLSTLVKCVLASRRPKGFPAGPGTVPLLGNLHLLPASKAFLKFQEWRGVYGDIIGLKFGPTNVVVLNSYKHVKELFDKRGGIYSSRPESYIGNELLCPGEVHILLVGYSGGWRKLRKAVSQLLNVNAVDSMLPIQNAEAMQTLHDIVLDPDNYFDHIRRYSTAVILASVYGQRGATFDSEKVQALYHAQDQFTEILEPGATPPVDAFPFLKYLPEFLAPWKARARAIRREQRTLYGRLLTETKAKLAKGEAEDCFIARLLRDKEKSGLTDDQVMYTGGILMEAGSDTTASTLLSFCLALIAYPQVLKLAQDEVDALCPERTPTIDDLKGLPYLRACMAEILRWRPVAAGGIPHVLTEDDVYGDYLIPKGTMLFANAWSIHMDESEYDNPGEFRPERWLDNKFGTTMKQSEATSDNRRVTYAFGAGRRICSGQRLAENSLIVNMAKIVWTFNITASAPVDTSIETGYNGGFLLCPKKYPAIFRVRSEKHRQIVEREYKSAEIYLRRFQ